MLLIELRPGRRKHTTGLHLDALIREALTEYLERLPDFGRMHDELTSGDGGAKVERLRGGGKVKHPQI
ncbi:MAG: hypothetical protein ACYTFI_17215 [Planctomycetota bacterium]|jgi:hypothetical protein